MATNPIGTGADQIAPDTTKARTSGAMTLPIGVTMTPGPSGQVCWEFTSDTLLTIRARGDDGIVRSATITLT